MRVRAVRVARRVERTLRRSHIALHVAESFAGDPRKVFTAGYLEPFEVVDRQERVVVEHLLEVRNQPPRVGRVAVESAADLVVHAAGRHFLHRQRGHLQKLLVARAAVMAKEKANRQTARKFWRATGTPVG